MAQTNFAKIAINKLEICSSGKTASLKFYKLKSNDPCYMLWWQMWKHLIQACAEAMCLILLNVPCG